MNIVEPIRDNEKVKEVYNFLQKRNERDALLFLFGIYTGLRISDILKFKVMDTYKKGYSIREQKTKKQKIYDWNPILYRALKKYVENKNPEEYLFKSREGNNKPITRNRAYGIIKEACNACGVYNVGTHTLRKTFGYHFYQQSKTNMAVLMEIYNHSSEFITLRYIGITQEISNKKMKNLRIFS